MNEIEIKPGDQFTWNGIECTVIVPYEMSVLCVRTGTASGKFGVPINDVLIAMNPDRIKIRCLQYTGWINTPHAKCTTCGEEEWQHKLNKHVNVPR